MEQLFLQSMQREHASSIVYSKLADFKAPVPIGSDKNKSKKGNPKEKAED